MGIYTLLYLINKEVLYSTGNSAQYSVTTQTGEQLEKEWMHV